MRNKSNLRRGSSVRIRLCPYATYGRTPRWADCHIGIVERLNPLTATVNLPSEGISIRVDYIDIEVLESEESKS